jgi:hypothetical protein
MTDNGITPKTWAGVAGGENRYYVTGLGWTHRRRVIERDGLICFQVTVGPERSCTTCAKRVSFLKQQLANQNIQHFWTCEPDDDSPYVTVRPPHPSVSSDKYLSFLLEWPVVM